MCTLSEPREIQNSKNRAAEKKGTENVWVGDINLSPMSAKYVFWYNELGSFIHNSFNTFDHLKLELKIGNLL